MSEFQERHSDLISLIRLSKLQRELHNKALDTINQAIDTPTPEAIDEALLSLGEYELVRQEFLEKIGKDK